MTADSSSAAWTKIIALIAMMQLGVVVGVMTFSAVYAALAKTFDWPPEWPIRFMFWCRWGPLALLVPIAWLASMYCVVLVANASRTLLIWLALAGLAFVGVAGFDLLRLVGSIAGYYGW